MKIYNTTTIPNSLVREVIRHTRPPNIARFDVMLVNSQILAGCAYCRGSAYHCSKDPFVRLRLPVDTPKYSNENGKRVYYSHYPMIVEPYQYGQLKGVLWWVADRIEALVYLSAHEFRHLWQENASDATVAHHRGYAWGSRGRFSEVDTESYAIRKLREWRRQRRVLDGTT